MRCIIVDDEPIAREGLEVFIRSNPGLELIDSFESAESASTVIKTNQVDLVFLDIEMPEINGLEFARTIPQTTLIIFTTAYSEYALDSYEVDALDYLVKPIEFPRFQKAVEKAMSYHALLTNAENERFENTENNYILVKSERRFFKIYHEDILFIEGLKNYVIIQTAGKRIITHIYLGTIYELLPHQTFYRISKSYIVNIGKVDSFDNNDVFIGDYEIGIGNAYRENFYEIFMKNRIQ